MAKRPSKQTLKDKVQQGKQNQKSDFVAGVHGDYFIGTDPVTLHHFSIETVQVPGNPFRDAYELKKITGDVSIVTGGPGVHIPFAWLFKEASTCKFAPGAAGTVQADMLAFLKDSLREELAAAHEAWIENQVAKQPQISPLATEEELDILAQTKANTLMEQVAIRPHDLIFKIATVDGKAVKPRRPREVPMQARPQENLLPLSVLKPGKFGRYDFGVKDRHCIVDYFPIDKERTMLRVIAIHLEHPLAQVGVSPGSGLLGYHLSKEKPLPFPKKFEGKDKELYETRVLMRDFFIRKLDEVGKVSKVEKQSHNEQAAA